MKLWADALEHEPDIKARLIWLFIAQHGWRPSQAGRMKWRNIRYDARGKPYSIIAGGQEKGFMFGRLRKRWQLPKLRSLDLRHLAATTYRIAGLSKQASGSKAPQRLTRLLGPSRSQDSRMVARGRRWAAEGLFGGYVGHNGVLRQDGIHQDDASCPTRDINPLITLPESGP